MLRVSDTHVTAVTWFDLTRSEGLKQATEFIELKQRPQERINNKKTTVT